MQRWIKKIVRPDFFTGENDQAAYSMYVINLAILVLLPIVTIYYSITMNSSISIVLGSVYIISLFTFLLIQRQRFQLAAMLLMAGLLAATDYLIIISQAGIHDPVVLILPGLMIAASLVIDLVS